MGYRCGWFRAEVLNNCYEEKLNKIRIAPKVYELFELVLEDENIFSYQRNYLDERNKILDAISKQELTSQRQGSNPLEDKIDFDDFSKLKGEQTKVLDPLDLRLNNINQKLANYE